MKRIALVLGLLVALSGCGQDLSRDVNFFRNHWSHYRDANLSLRNCTDDDYVHDKDGIVWVESCGARVGVRKDGSPWLPSDLVWSYDWREDYSGGDGWNVFLLTYWNQYECPSWGIYLEDPKDGGEWHECAPSE